MSDVRAPAGARAAALGALVAAVAGLAVGVAWEAVAPTPVVEDLAGVLVSQAEPEFLAAQTATFALLATVAGMLQGMILVARPTGERPAGALASLAGATAGSVLAWRLGALLGPPPLAAQRDAAGAALRAPLDVHTPGVLLLWPATAAAVLFTGLLLRGLLARPAVSAGDRGADPAGQAQQVGGRELDVQSPAPRAHEHGG